MSSSDIAISVSDVSKCYTLYSTPRDRLKQFFLPRLQRFLGQPQRAYYQEFWALQNISLSIHKGETVGILGRNGSGKSTLLQLICGTLAPSTGSIKTKGTIAALLELGSGFNPEFSGRDNVYMNATILGLSPAEIDERYDDIVSFADIGEFIDRPVKTYSSGMVVRLAFAVSVMVNPDILVVDEALSVGDAGFQFKCLERINQLKAEGVTVLFVSHSMDMIKTFCDRAVFLKNGQIAAHGSPEDMAEMYLMDVRSDQLKSNNNALQMEFREGLNGGIAFGTTHGKILGAGFVGCDDELAPDFKFGDVVKVWTKFHVHDSIENPAITLLLQDSKLLTISGSRIDLQQRAGELYVEFAFPVELAAGNYFVTLRLEDYRRELSSFYILEKQSGALRFEVQHAKERTFLGLIDLGIEGQLGHDA